MDILVFVLFAIGLLLIIKGGDYFVDAASWIAEVSGIPKFIIGATVVSIATTLPELIVSAIAAFEGKPDMAIGNAIGSVTANTGLIMAISIVCIPAAIRRSAYLVKSLLLILAVAGMWIFSLSGQLSPIGCVALIIIFAVFIYENIQSAKKGASSERTKVQGKREVWINLIKFIGGCAGIVIGANLLVDNGSTIAAMIGIPESVIAVTMIAIGTSLPELVTTITAIVKKQSALSVGNIIGANIIDTTLILPVCAVISGQTLPMSAQTFYVDLPICLLVIIIMLVPALIQKKFSRWQGITSLLVYLSYLAYTFIA